MVRVGSRRPQRIYSPFTRNTRFPYIYICISSHSRIWFICVLNDRRGRCVPFIRDWHVLALIHRNVDHCFGRNANRNGQFGTQMPLPQPTHHNRLLTLRCVGIPERVYIVHEEVSRIVCGVCASLMVKGRWVYILRRNGSGSTSCSITPFNRMKWLYDLC